MSKLTRKEFVQVINKLLTVLGVSAVVGPVIGFFYPLKLETVPSEPVFVCTSDDLLIGQSKTVPFGRYPALVIHTPAGLKAYSAVCTHFACVTRWDDALGQIVCPCHEGFFDVNDGQVISGPPPKGLQPLDINIVDGDIYVGVQS